MATLYTEILATTKILVHAPIDEREAEQLLRDTLIDTLYDGAATSFNRLEMVNFEIKEDK